MRTFDYFAVTILGFGLAYLVFGFIVGRVAQSIINSAMLINGLG